MSYNIEVESGKTVKLPTAGKYCDRNIVVTATGGGGGSDQYATSLQSRFYGATFPEGYDLRLTIGAPTYGDHMSMSGFCEQSTGLKSVTLACGESDVTINCSTAFAYCKTLETVDLTGFNRNISNATMVFFQCFALSDVLGELDFTNNTSTTHTFYSCTALEEVRFKKNSLFKSMGQTFIGHCSNLSDASIQSLIDGLADLTGQTSQQISLHTDVLARLTDTQYAEITTKNWTIE